MLMIPDSLPSPQAPDWKIELSRSFRNLQQLLDFCAIDYPSGGETGKLDFPFKVTRYYASLIEKGNPNDPLLLQVLPDTRETLSVDGYSLDAVGDQQAMAVPGLIHKYHGRALLTLSPACAIHCRYCFRKHFAYAENISDISLSGELFAYLSRHTEIREVILSGGDPLMLSDDKIRLLVDNLNRIPHIRLLRIHSRLPSVLPERINDSLVSILQRFTGQVVVITHINHAREIAAQNQQVLQTLAHSGFRLFNQSVLLKHINDNAELLTELSYRLLESCVTPYYLHRLDKVEGTHHFDIDDSEACRIYTQLRGSVPGYLLPRMVQEIPGRPSKTTVHCD